MIALDTNCLLRRKADFAYALIIIKSEPCDEYAISTCEQRHL